MCIRDRINTVPIAGHKIPEKIVTIKGINHQLFIKDIIRMIRYDQKYRTLKDLENDGNQTQNYQKTGATS